MAGDVPRRTDHVVIGGGQAGLVASWHLQRAGRDHVVLERRESLGGGWQDRWDEFRLVGPAWTTSLPGVPYDGDDPDGFMRRDEVVARMARYAGAIGAPVALGAAVETMRPTDAGWRLETSQGPVDARAVTVATGGFHRPYVPPVGDAVPAAIHRLHSQDYRREADLPDGGVLIVGTGQTGTQLAEELMDAGREVFLCVGHAGRAPRRYRGDDIFVWMRRLVEEGPAVGVELPTVVQLPDPAMRVAGNAQLSGHKGGHSPDLRALGRDGAHLVGRLESGDGGRCRLGGDLAQTLDQIDRFFEEGVQQLLDAFIEASGMDAPPAEPPVTADFAPEPVDQLDLEDAGIGTVLWATGYRQDLGWIDAPATDAMGFAIQDRGVSPLPGLSFLGGLWQHDMTSSTLVGIERDGRLLADRLGLAA